MKLSIIIPVFNEEKTIQSVLEKVYSLVIPKMEKEIIVIDDGSTDNTAQKIQQFVKSHKNISFFKQIKNMGKGSAVVAGFAHVKGEYIIIQDADLEYNPQDIIKLVQVIQKNKNIAVYGT